jgi:hypothetical protein
MTTDKAHKSHKMNELTLANSKRIQNADEC